MTKIILVLFILTMTIGCKYNRPRHEVPQKPYIIVSKKLDTDYWMKETGRIMYVYISADGQMCGFIDSQEAYSVGDTIK